MEWLNGLNWFKNLSFLLWFEDWWKLLSFELQVFYFIGLVSTLFLVFQTLLLLFGLGDADVPDEIAPDGHFPVDGDVKLLSIRTVSAFFVGFGWTGVIGVKHDLPLYGSVFFAMLVGTVFLTVVVVLMRMMYGLRSSGNIDYRNAIGQVGTVYIPIPPHQSGAGQVEITIQGRLRFVEALTLSGNRLPGQSKVKVVGTIDSTTVLVEPLASGVKEEQA